MDVPTLTSQMHETLSTIHSTIASLNSLTHDERLDELEKQRDSALSSLRTAFEQESEALLQKRRAEKEEIEERRRREDEERERRRRLEDEELSEQRAREDAERTGRLDEEAKGVEEETDEQMASVEGDAQQMIEEGRERLRQLEEKRRVSNPLLLPSPVPHSRECQMTDPILPDARKSTVFWTSNSTCLSPPLHPGGGARVVRRPLPFPFWPHKVSRRRPLWLTNVSVTVMSRPLKMRTAPPPSRTPLRRAAADRQCKR